MRRSERDVAIMCVWPGFGVCALVAARPAMCVVIVAARLSLCVLILDTLSASSTSHNDFIGVLMKVDSFVNQSHISLTFFAYVYT